MSLLKIKVKGVSLALVVGMLLVCLFILQLQYSLKAHASSSWTASSGFSSTQGLNQWSYQQRPVGGGAFSNMPTFSSGSWRGGSGNWIFSISSHPDNSNDAVRKWTAPATGTVSITGRAYKIDTAGGNGVVVTVQKNSTSLWTRTIAFNDGTGYTTDASLTSVAVTAGDAIYFIVNNNGDYSFDETGWDPTITYSAPLAWTASTGFSSTQGQDNWYYQQRPVAGGAYTNLTYSSSAWRGAGLNWMTGTGTHPDNTNDTVRKWVAPAAGNISITGRAYKVDLGGGNGVKVSVLKNATSLWTKTIAYNDGTGYLMDADLSNVAVAAGDAIYFIVNNNGDWAYDDTGWNPTITYVDAPTWALNTTDTNLLLSVNSNKPSIVSLKNPTQNWNWTPTAAVIPLLNTVYIGATAYTPNWVYQDAVVNTSVGTKVTLRFTSTTPNLELKTIWWAQPGVGPVEENTTIQNNTGSSITYNYADVIATDITTTADNTVTLTRFDRASMNPGATGVYKDTITASSNIGSEISNDYNTGAYVLPYELLDVNSTHGLYMGYTWDFGRFSNSTSGNALQIRNKFYLGNSGSVTEANGKIFNVPGMFYGTYQGDIDTGSNSMKKWFWNNKMTPTLKANSNEPLVEYSVDSYSESGINSFLASNPLAAWGVELFKEDAWWTSDVGTDPPFGWGWNPNPSYWPSGFTLGTTAHATCSGTNCLKLSLYMGNRYAHNDLSTQTGRDNEKAALLTRYDNWHYDYWRSDMEFEPTSDYLSHEGFLEVLDYMIANRPNFRWENCSAGGSKKSFDLLQRQTVMTTEDSGASTGSTEKYRMAFYSNSYMINPVQLKDDNGDFAINTPTFGKYMFRTGFLGAWMYGSNGATTNQAAEYQTAIGLYKTKQRPILRGADVYHILPMPDGVNWDGMQYFNTALNKGSVLLFHPSNSAASSKVIKLKGLVSGTTYTLTFQDRTAQNTTMTGAQLMTTGINVTGMTGDYASEIIWIN